MDKLISAFSLARRAGAIAPGFDAATSAIKARKAFAVFACRDISQGTLDRLTRLTAVTVLEQDIDYFTPIYKKGVGIFAVTDENFARLITKTLEDIQREHKV